MIKKSKKFDFRNQLISLDIADHDHKKSGRDKAKREKGKDGVLD